MGMMTDTENPGDPGRDKIVVRICAACGVVNPAGPAESCPHLQLARFEGLDPELESLLGRVAEARRRYFDLAAGLRSTVLQALRAGRAIVETPLRAGPPTPIEGLNSRNIRPAPRLALTSPEPPANRADEPRRRPRPAPRSSLPREVDSRQLELLILGPPKGHA